MVPRARQVLVGFLALVLTPAIPVASQTNAPHHQRLEIAPAFGTYMPTGRLDVSFNCAAVKGVRTYCPDLTTERSAAIGARVTRWLGRRGGIEGSLWYSRGGVADASGYPTYYPSGISGGRVWLASLRALCNLIAPAPNTSLVLVGGPAVVQRAGDGWSYDRKGVLMAGMVGVGVDIHPGNGGGVRATIEEYLYNVLGAMRHDAVLSLSLAMSPSARRKQ